MNFDYNDLRINILDTPGHQDFSEDTYRALAAADNAIMLLDGGKGLEQQTRKLFEVCRLRNLPVSFGVSFDDSCHNVIPFSFIFIDPFSISTLILPTIPSFPPSSALYVSFVFLKKILMKFISMITHN